MSTYRSTVVGVVTAIIGATVLVGAPITAAQADVDPTPSESPSPTDSSSPDDSESPTPTPTPTATSPVISIAAMQRQLNALKFPKLKVTGKADAATKQAVCAWRELSGRTINRKAPTKGEQKAIITTALNTKWSVPKAVTKKKVSYAVNMSCQTATWIKQGHVTRIMAVSTGKYQGATRRGLFRVYWQYPGKWQRSLFVKWWQPADMYRPIYFDGNIAVHGVRPAVKPVPQSHGCVRAQRVDQDFLRKKLTVGKRVLVYGDYWTVKTGAFGTKVTKTKEATISVPTRATSPNHRPVPIG